MSVHRLVHTAACFFSESSAATEVGATAIEVDVFIAVHLQPEEGPGNFAWEGIRTFAVHMYSSSCTPRPVLGLWVLIAQFPTGTESGACFFVGLCAHSLDGIGPAVASDGCAD